MLGAVVLAGACTHAHLSPSYGRSYDAWFSAQHVREAPADSEPTKRALGSLDAQEAAAISKSYRRTTNKEETPGQGQMLMIGQSRGGEAYLPPPSVPGSP
jgi:hypothetical protein